MSAKEAARKQSSIYHAGSLVEPLDQNFDFPIDQPIDLGLAEADGPGEASLSISAPDWDGFPGGTSADFDFMQEHR